MMYLRAFIGIAGLLLVVWALRVDHLRSQWRDRHAALSIEADAVLAATRVASDNPALRWDGVPHQVLLLGGARDEWKAKATDISNAVEQMGRESDRLRAENEALILRVRSLNAKRDELISDLEGKAMQPGDVADCLAQVRAIDDALNALRREGF